VTVSMTKTAHAQTVLLALEVLEAVAGQDRVTLSGLARHLDMTTTRAHRLLLTLEASGYLTRADDRSFGLGPKLLYLGHRAARGNSLLRAAAPVLESLAGESGESALLAVRVGFERLIVDSRDAGYGPQIAWPRDARLPLHSGALGICLLAYAPAEVQEEALRRPMQAFTPHTVADAEALRAAMTSVRRRGSCTARHSYVAGVVSIAAPILGPDRTAPAALAIVGDSERLEPSLEERYEREVRLAAAKVASFLASGWDR
jgi:DNA-binding IclR family transcriptional regulator